MSKKKKEVVIEEEASDAALQLAIATVRKEYGKGSIVMGDMDFSEIQRMSTGSISLDQALSGGYAKGRLIEIFGPESSGKTTLALHAIAECQKAGGVAAFIDAEHALDAFYANDLGVDMEKVLFSQPECGEDAMNIVETLIRSSSVSLIVVDSVAALVPRSEIEKNVGDSVMGKHAQMMSQTCRKIAGITLKTGTTVIFINQLRSKIGIVFGNPEVTTGGAALKFYCSQRLDIRRCGLVKTGDEITGISSKVKIAKNKTGRPFKAVQFDIIFGKGIDWHADLLKVGVEHGLIEQSGAWYSYKGERIGQGAAKAAQALRGNSEWANEIRTRILAS